MSHQENNWHLPSEVETDSECPESRVPLLGLHMMSHPAINEVKFGNLTQIDSICDSGLGSLSIGGISTQISSTGDLDETLQQFLRLSVAPPHTGMSDGDYVSDNGFESGHNLVSYPGFATPNMDIANQVFVRDEDGDTQLHMAIIHKCTDVALNMIDIAPSQEYLNIQNNLRQTVLHLATCTNQVSVVRKLVARGALIDAQDHHGNTALHIACRDGNRDCVQALTQPVSNQELKECPYAPVFQKIPQDPEIRNYEGQTCLHLAAAQGHLEVMVYLLSAKVGVNVNAPDGRSGKTILHHAIEAQCIPTLVLLLRLATVDVNARTFNGVTPLQLAMSCGSHDIVKALLAKGAVPTPHETDSDYDSSGCDSDEFMDV